jgi:major vault protein
MEKRDLVLAPGTYAYMQDVTKGVVKTYTGPTVINPTAQEVPVVYDPDERTFKRADSLEAALCTAVVADEGFYIVLKNPAKQNKHPDDGATSMSADLDVGRAIIIPGPAVFALWPMQAAEVVQGHHLRSNQYLLVRVYNEDEARANWKKAVVKPAEATAVGVTPPEKPVVTAPPPADLTVGKLIIIRGTEVSFYIPPTGVEVVADSANTYVRDALTLERLEYCILVDENGKKRYERGPQVVFPIPSERFIEREAKGHARRKFSAIELNEIQGLHIKVIADYKDERSGKDHKAGDELFITGKDEAIYFPREEHSLISYDGRSKHFATAVPAGEARYVMNRVTGEIRTERGPKMLLPDPRMEVIVRRVLSDKQGTLWYPGNPEVLAYNQWLRDVLSKAPTTRSGAVSEGDFERNAKVATQQAQRGGGAAPVAAVMAMSNQGYAAMEKSLVSADQAAMMGDEFTRGSNYTQPRSITLQTKYEGAPAIQAWTGYAVMIVSKTGNRRVEIGPKNVLMEYDEALEVLELSTGKPKTTDNLLKTVYLRVLNNKIGDIVTDIETSDHIRLNIKLSLRVNFEGEPSKWFEVENYVKYLTDHVRSVLKGTVKKQNIEQFYAGAVDIIRDTILGKQVEKNERPGMTFKENGMRVTDVEVLEVKITDQTVAGLLAQAQHNVVKGNIELAQAARDLDVARQQEEFTRQKADFKAVTLKRVLGLEVDEIVEKQKVAETRIRTQREEQSQLKELEVEKQAVIDTAFAAKLKREKDEADQKQQINAALQQLTIELTKADADAVVQRFAAAQPGFAEALRALQNDDVFVKVAQAWSIQRVIGGENVSDALKRVFEGTPVGTIVGKLLGSNGNGQHEGVKPTPSAPATRP